jgi:Flp pilus assembly protein TadD
LRAYERVFALSLVTLVSACSTPADPFRGPDGYKDSTHMTTENREADMDPGAVGSSAAMARIARKTRAAGDPHSAINVYKRAHQLRPAHVPILIELGETLASVGAYEEARAVLAKAVMREPKNARALRGLGNALVGLGEPSMAVEHYQTALAIASEPTTYNGLGVALDLTGDAKAAEAAYRAGLKIAPEKVSLRGNLGLSLALAGKYKDAIAILANLVKSGQSTARTRQNLALVYGIAGRSKDARMVLNMDLGPRVVQNNIAYYEMLRTLSSAERREMVLNARRVSPRHHSSARAAPAR